MPGGFFQCNAISLETGNANSTTVIAFGIGVQEFFIFVSRLRTLGFPARVEAAMSFALVAKASFTFPLCIGATMTYFALGARTTPFFVGCSVVDMSILQKVFCLRQSVYAVYKLQTCDYVLRDIVVHDCSRHVSTQLLLITSSGFCCSCRRC